MPLTVPQLSTDEGGGTIMGYKELAMMKDEVHTVVDEEYIEIVAPGGGLVTPPSVADLREAAVKSLAGDRMATDVFGTLQSVAQTIHDSEDFLRTLKAIENETKEEYKITKMPASWRSAKSILVTCLRWSIPLMYLDGKYKGKTQLQQEIKIVKASSCVVDPLTSFIASLGKTRRVFDSFDTAQQNYATDFLKRTFSL